MIGIFACFSIIAIFTGGKNYFKMSKDLGKLYDVYEVLMNNYYGEVDGEKLVDAAISGMVSSVGDAYTSYSDIDTTDNFDELVNGVYEGIGCTIYQLDDNIKIYDVYEGGSAFKAGLKKDDIVKSVDGMNAQEMGVNKLSEYIKNNAQDKIVMEVVRDDEELTLILERDTVEIPSVTGEVMEINDKKIGYISISIFSSVTALQFEEKLKALEKEEIQGLVIDVRDNSGGYLSTVTSILSHLLPKGKIIYQVQKDDNIEVTKDKTTDKREYPIAVLTNMNSASASEILAAAIKESYGGFVVGTKTYGKGTVQQVKKLSDGSMVKYTVENWLTPNGNWIDGVGVEPTDVLQLSEDYYKEPITTNDNQLQKALQLVSK